MVELKRKKGFNVFVDHVYRTIKKKQPIFQSEIYKYLPDEATQGSTKTSLKYRVVRACIQLSEEGTVKRSPYDPDKEYGGAIAEMDPEELRNKRQGRFDAYICEVKE